MSDDAKAPDLLERFKYELYIPPTESPDLRFDIHMSGMGVKELLKAQASGGVIKNRGFFKLFIEEPLYNVLVDGRLYGKSYQSTVSYLWPEDEFFKDIERDRQVCWMIQFSDFFFESWKDRHFDCFYNFYDDIHFPTGFRRNLHAFPADQHGHFMSWGLYHPGLKGFFLKVVLPKVKELYKKEQKREKRKGSKR